MMLEFKQVTGAASDRHDDNPAATPLALGCFCSQRSMSKDASSHVEGSEPQADIVLRPSALHLAERIFKKLMKLRKKAGLSGLCSMYPSCLILPFDGPRQEETVTEAEPRAHSLDSVDAERDRCGYDSDEHSAGFVSVGTPTSSSSSFDSLTTSQAASTSASTNSGHKPGSQVMANVLLSLLSNDNLTLDEADDEADSGNESEEYHFGGPRESAWHQPEEEILTEQEWRIMRYGSKPAMAAFATETTPKPHSKHFATSSSFKQASFTIFPLHQFSVASRSKRESN